MLKHQYTYCSVTIDHTSSCKWKFGAGRCNNGRKGRAAVLHCACVCVFLLQGISHTLTRKADSPTVEKSITEPHMERKQDNRARGMEGVSVRFFSPPKVKKQNKQKRQSGLDKDDGN